MGAIGTADPIHNCFFTGMGCPIWCCLRRFARVSVSCLIVGHFTRLQRGKKRGETQGLGPKSDVIIRRLEVFVDNVTCRQRSGESSPACSSSSFLSRPQLYCTVTQYDISPCHSASRSISAHLHVVPGYIYFTVKHRLVNDLRRRAARPPFS